ncbi:hypothetical protein DFP72DRAFT_345551 [Ephemerocybe angulata]|uniref:Uncharacterized protein n=1 Tax=Ephemerocybe angulata TaxID=980116 RepID=A0A8H6H5S7_9AGAR|nr:hypothetical protein DFP72DRAFT_345551 [Tulosesus angulatus]
MRGWPAELDPHQEKAFGYQEGMFTDSDDGAIIEARNQIRHYTERLYPSDDSIPTPIMYSNQRLGREHYDHMAPSISYDHRPGPFIPYAQGSSSNHALQPVVPPHSSNPQGTQPTGIPSEGRRRGAPSPVQAPATKKARTGPSHQPMVATGPKPDLPGTCVFGSEALNPKWKPPLTGPHITRTYRKGTTTSRKALAPSQPHPAPTGSSRKGKERETEAGGALQLHPPPPTGESSLAPSLLPSTPPRRHDATLEAINGSVPPSPNTEYKVSSAVLLHGLGALLDVIKEAFLKYVGAPVPPGLPVISLSDPWSPKADTKTAEDFISPNEGTPCPLASHHWDAFHSAAGGSALIGKLKTRGLVLELSHIVLTRSKNLVPHLITLLRRINECVDKVVKLDPSTESYKTDRASHVKSLFCRCINIHIIRPHGDKVWDDILERVENMWLRSVVSLPNSSCLPCLIPTPSESRVRHLINFMTAAGVGVNSFRVLEETPGKSRPFLTMKQGSTLEDVQKTLLHILWYENAEAAAKSRVEAGQDSASPHVTGAEASSHLDTSLFPLSDDPTSSTLDTRHEEQQSSVDALPDSSSSRVEARSTHQHDSAPSHVGPPKSLIAAIKALYPSLTSKDDSSTLTRCVNTNGVRVTSTTDGRRLLFRFEERKNGERQKEGEGKEGKGACQDVRYVCCVEMFSEPLLWWFISENIDIAIGINRAAVVSVYKTMTSGDPKHDDIAVRWLSYLHGAGIVLVAEYYEVIKELGRLPTREDIKKLMTSKARKLVAAGRPREAQFAFARWSRLPQTSLDEVMHLRQRMIELLRDLLQLTPEENVSSPPTSVFLPPHDLETVMGEDEGEEFLDIEDLTKASETYALGSLTD